MAATYTLIASNTLSSSAGSVTFSAIPATYKDLILRASIRTTQANPVSTTYWFVNNDESNPLYSNTAIYGTGSSVVNSRHSSDYAMGYLNTNGDTSTSNTFASVEIYIPNYASSVNKVASSFYGQENNQTEAYVGIFGSLYRSTTAISSITIKNPTFVSGSSFFLYGINNS